MAYKIFNGVEPPKKRGTPGMYEKMLNALTGLSVDDDKSAVKVVFDTEREMNGAKAAIYATNTQIAGKFRYSVISAPDEMAIYVIKVSIPQNGNGNGKHK